MDKIDSVITKIITFLNRTILFGYRKRQWDKHTSPQGYVLLLSDKQVQDLKSFWNDENG